jgi:DNA polymerase I-like protein with 3'-5' exonuclease and polymerase domains
MVYVVNDQNDDAVASYLVAVDKAIENGGCVVFDCEGVNLCRVGTVELVALCFKDEKDDVENPVFLVDLMGCKNPQVKTTLKKLFESDSVEKIIHDSRMDCDALFHLHGITLRNVHDTSCFHAVVTGREDVNLNETLQYNGLPTNTTRDSSIYKINPRFWATRPLTSKMIEWSSSDVDKLLRLAAKQKVTLVSGSTEAKEKSMMYTSVVRDMKLERSVRCHINIGRFIGPRGANIRRLQSHSGTMIYKDGDQGTWMVFYTNNSDLNKVKEAMGH